MFEKRKHIREKYGDDEKYKDKQHSLEVEKGDISAMFIAAIITIVLPIMAILGVLYFVLWMIFLR